MMTDPVPFCSLEFTLNVFDHLVKELIQRYDDLDELYNLCNVEEKPKYARLRASIHEYLHDIIRARASIYEYMNFYREAEHGKG